MDVVCRVVAIGSPHGDDQVAWRLAERLQIRKGINGSMIALSGSDNQASESIHA